MFFFALSVCRLVFGSNIYCRLHLRTWEDRCLAGSNAEITTRARLFHCVDYTIRREIQAVIGYLCELLYDQEEEEVVRNGGRMHCI